MSLLFRLLKFVSKTCGLVPDDGLIKLVRLIGAPPPLIVVCALLLLLVVVVLLLLLLFVVVVVFTFAKPLTEVRVNF